MQSKLATENYPPGQLPCARMLNYFVILGNSLRASSRGRPNRPVHFGPSLPRSKRRDSFFMPGLNVKHNAEAYPHRATSGNLPAVP